jgi:hypothetical protein
MLPAAVNTLMENEQQNLRQATDDEAARQYSLQDAAEPLDGDHLDVDNSRRQQHYESSTITAKQLGLQLPDTPSREKEPQRQSRFHGELKTTTSRQREHSWQYDRWSYKHISHEIAADYSSSTNHVAMNTKNHH